MASRDAVLVDSPLPTQRTSLIISLEMSEMPSAEKLLEGAPQGLIESRHGSEFEGFGRLDMFKENNFPIGSTVNKKETEGKAYKPHYLPS